MWVRLLLCGPVRLHLRDMISTQLHTHTHTHTNHLSTPLVPLQVWQVRDLVEIQPLPEGSWLLPPGTCQPLTLAAGRASGR